MIKKLGLNIAKICVGTYFIVSVFYVYVGDFNYLYELTSISNLLYGIVLIVCGIFGLCKKQLNMIVNLMAFIKLKKIVQLKFDENNKSILN